MFTEPLWEVVVAAVPVLQDFLDCIRTNKEKWDQLESLDRK